MVIALLIPGVEAEDVEELLEEIPDAIALEEEAEPEPEEPPEAVSEDLEEDSTPTPEPEPEADTGDSVTSTASTTGVPWDELAVCESGMGGEPRWDVDTNNGFYGGLQFEKQSWDWAIEENNLDKPEWPHHASREQQISVAENLLDIHPAGIGAWPACADRLGLR